MFDKKLAIVLPIVDRTMLVGRRANRGSKRLLGLRCDRRLKVWVKMREQELKMMVQAELEHIQSAKTSASRSCISHQGGPPTESARRCGSKLSPGGSVTGECLSIRNSELDGSIRVTTHITSWWRCRSCSCSNCSSSPC